MAWMYLNLTSFCFSVPYALSIKKKIIKNLKKRKMFQLTYPNPFEPQTAIFWPHDVNASVRELTGDLKMINK